MIINLAKIQVYTRLHSYRLSYGILEKHPGYICARYTKHMDDTKQLYVNVRDIVHYHCENETKLLFPHKIFSTPTDVP